MNAPLAGVRIVDLSRLLPGPFCTWLLSSLGAEVIRVEPPGGGDYSRQLPPLISGHGVFFAALNRGKRSVALDIRQEQGRRGFEALLHSADVLLEGFKPGTLARAGLSGEDMLSRHPKLVIASISGFGQSGPLAQEPGHDLNYQGYAGIVAGQAHLEPSVVQVADLAGGALMAALGIVSALYGVARGGAGRWLDCSMTDGALALMAPQLAVAQAEGRPLRPGGELLTGGAAHYRCYRCADGRWITLAPLEPKFWAALREAIPECPEGPDAAALTAIFSSQPAAHWIARAPGACVGPVLRARELPEHPLHKARGNFERVLGIPMAKAPFPWAPEPVVPRLGEHTRQILGPLGVDVDALLKLGQAQEA
ncbi:MAG: CaiB/BaiF CoA-transferase family protein [Myxococcota bacterium]|nr:CaiB/BaiF CoA-transferase family protein [Myxococcota bacterium]